MRLARVKTAAEQAVSQLHATRDLPVKSRVAAANHIRAQLLEYGIAIPQSVRMFETRAAAALHDDNTPLPPLARQSLLVLWARYQHTRARVKDLERHLQQWRPANAASQRLAKIPGVGVMTATALIGKLGDGRDFQRGREVSAYPGLVPKQASSGERHVLRGTAKRGDGAVRRLLILGAKSALRHAQRRKLVGRPDDTWADGLLQRMHPNKAAVALANKTARVAWAVLSREVDYRHPDAAAAAAAV